MVPVKVTTRTAALDGALQLPADPLGLVLFAHGSGSSHRSPRNAAVATLLEQHGFASLRFDLLTPEEAEDRRNVFDTELLTQRLVDATQWAMDRPELAKLPVSYFGASTGAAAALIAAARLPSRIAAVVSRGGRPDMAMSDLPRVKAPTLLIVGQRDETVLELNQAALRELGGIKRLVVVPGATHLFEEPGTLDQAAAAAVAWLESYGAPVPRTA